MNDKDRESFDIWVWDKFNLTYELNPSQYDDLKDSWQAACEYRQKEIDKFEWELNHRSEIIKNLRGELLEYKEAASSEAALVNELQAENAELKQKILETWKEAEKFYLDD